MRSWCPPCWPASSAPSRPIERAGRRRCGRSPTAGRAGPPPIRGGENISPSEIEDALLRHPAVVGAAVVGLPDVEWGERVAAMVTVLPDAAGVDPAGLREWSRRQLGSIKTPEVIAVADELPQTPTGKVLRRAVREQLEKQK